MKLSAQYDIKSKQFIDTKLPEIMEYRKRLNSVINKQHKVLSDIREDLYKCALSFKESSAYSRFKEMVVEIEDAKNHYCVVNNTPTFFIREYFDKRVKLWRKTGYCFASICNLQRGMEQLSIEQVEEKSKCNFMYLERFSYLTHDDYIVFFSEQEQEHIRLLSDVIDAKGEAISDTRRKLSELDYLSKKLDKVIEYVNNTSLHSALADAEELDKLFEDVKKQFKERRRN